MIDWQNATIKVEAVGNEASTGRCCILLIDGEQFIYDVELGNTYLGSYGIGDDDGYFLDTELPMNFSNPKETLDRFFKLLILQ